MAKNKEEYQIARNTIRRMKKLGGYFCFKKTRIDGKTKGKMFGGIEKFA